MIKSDKGKKVFGLILILAIIVSVFGGVVSADDLSEGLKQSVADAEIETAVGNVSSEELTEALDAVTDDPVNIEFADQSAGLGVVSSRSSYDRQAAYNYAMQWWDSCNHDCTCGDHESCTPWSYWGWECCGYSSHGGDCANFVSQCLIAGGHPYLNTGDPCRGYPCGKEEIGAKRLGDCLVSKGWARTCGYHASPPSDIDVGDVLIYHTDSCDDWSAHATIVTYVSGSDVQITCHSENRKNEPYTYLSTLRPYYEWLHCPESVVQPTVETRSATSITETAATLNGEITDDGGASIDERGLLWGEGDTLTDLTKDVTISGNHFSFCLTGLKPDTKYSFMAYAKNSAGTGEGNILSFRTSAECPTPGTPSNPSPSNDAIDVTINTDLDWSDCSNTDFYDVYFGTSSPPPYYGSAPTSSYPFQNNLDYNTKYYWKILAKNNCGGNTSGPIWDFTTEEEPNQPPNRPSIPSGPTLGQIGISYTYSTVTTDPNSDNVYYWFDWGDDSNSGWIGRYPSGTSGSASKEWSNPGNYNVKTKAKDEHGAESSPLWSDSLPVCINGLWEDDPINQCKERRLTCTGEYEYRNKDDGLICDYGPWEGDPGNTCKERREILKCVAGTCTPSGEYEYKNKADGTICGHGEWEDDPANQCKERREIQKCVSGTCTPSGEYEYKNKADGTICGHGEWEDDPANQCKERREIQKCVSGTCTPSGEYEYKNKPDGTICGCTVSNTLKRCDGGVCTDTGICDSTTCDADAPCDGKEPGDSCGGGICDSTCKCGGQAVGEDTAVIRNGRWYVDTDHDHAANEGFWYGKTTDIPLTGDVNQDGKDDIIVVRNGRWYVDTDHDHAADEGFWYGKTTDIPLIGDVNQDGKDDIIVVRDGRWYVDTDHDHAADESFYYGRGTDIPLAGDVNQDGKDDTIVVRSGRWYVDTNHNYAADESFYYGKATDIPLVGDIE